MPLPAGMGQKYNRSATAVMTVGGLTLLLAVIGGIALVTRTEPLVSEVAGKAVVSGHAAVIERPGR